jgi:hypothetical protein
MSALVKEEGPTIVELDGPERAYFEIPLDYWATANGELEAESHPDVARLVQRVVYVNFKVRDALHVRVITQRVTQALKELGGGYIWWRKHPEETPGPPRVIALRLGTTPQLALPWWQTLCDDVENQSLDNCLNLLRYR